MIGMMGSDIPDMGGFDARRLSSRQDAERWPFAVRADRRHDSQAVFFIS
jgi:hypothetical protein